MLSTMQARASKQKKERAKETSPPERTAEQRAAEQQAAKDKAELRERTDAMLADIDEALQGIDNDLATKFTQKGGE